MKRLATIAGFLVVLVLGAVALPSHADAASPTSLNLYVSSGFRYQDPNFSACTSTSAMDMLNFIALRSHGGTGFRWKVTLSGTTRDSILAWERTHDTLAGGTGSDPHGVRNALNYYGWGSGALIAGSRVYEDVAYSSYASAVKRAVRSMILTRKPVAILAWAGRHMQMMTGYYGLSGDPFARDSQGHYTNAFSVGGFYLADPLKSDAFVNRTISYTGLRTTTNLKFRFRPYLETDSPYDDPYTPGVVPARQEWYGKYVLVVPLK